jgi:hypothetical protein
MHIYGWRNVCAEPAMQDRWCARFVDMCPKEICWLFVLTWWNTICEYYSKHTEAIFSVFAVEPSAKRPKHGTELQGE